MLLEISDVTVEIGTRSPPLLPVRGVSMNLARDDSLAIVGESGSGKSILAKTIMRLLAPGMRVTDGRVAYQGRDVYSMTPREARNLRGEEIAMIFQDPLSSLNPVHTVGRQIAETFVKRRGMARGDAMKEAVRLMEDVRIPSASRRAQDYPHQFSGGMRQRVMIAIAIALKPSILIADEPTTALDVTVQRQIMELLAELRREHAMSMVFITHDLRLAESVVNRVAVMYAGRIVESGPLEDIYRSPEHPYTRALIESIPDRARRGQPLHEIPGSPPSLGSRPSGCAFHTRCPRAEATCTLTDPQHVSRAELNRTVACHFPLVEVPR